MRSLPEKVRAMRRVDWTGWLKSKWARSRSSATRRRLVSEPSPRTRYRDLGSWVEFLELREMLAAVTWDGGAGTFNWNDADNWDNDTRPGSSDDVSFGTLAGQTVTVSGADVPFIA